MKLIAKPPSRLCPRQHLRADARRAAWAATRRRHRALDAGRTRRLGRTWSAILFAPAPLRAGAAPRLKGSRWAGPRHLILRRSRMRPPDAARGALRSTNSPGATMSAYPPFAVRREPR